MIWAGIGLVAIGIILHALTWGLLATLGWALAVIGALVLVVGLVLLLVGGSRGRVP